MDNPLNINYGLINIDLGPLCEVANNLIDKLSSAIGWIANRPTPDRIAQKTYIESIETSDYPSLIKAAMISKANETIKEYSNQCNIIKYAIDNLNSKAEPELVENDWLAQFMNKSKLVSNEQFQLIWGKILANECNSPNSIPKGLLHILEQMDNDDAAAFNKLCSLAIYTESNGEKVYIPMIVSSQLNNYYKNIGLTYDMLSDLQSLGLIEVAISRQDNEYIKTLHDITPPIIHYFDETFQFPNRMHEFNCGNVIFTKSGQALCGVVNAEKLDGFFSNQCISIWEKQIRELNH